MHSRSARSPHSVRWPDAHPLEKAELEYESGRFKAAIETAGQAIEQLATESPEERLRGHLIRVRATLAGGDLSRGEPDIEAILAILPELGALPKDVLHALMTFSTAIGPERMSVCIRTSPSASLLLPLTTALERELGLEPRVAREVEEIAQDIRRDLAKLKEPRGDTRWHAIPQRPGYGAHARQDTPRSPRTSQRASLRVQDCVSSKGAGHNSV